MENRIHRRAACALALLIVLTLLFIWGNSMQSGDVSGSMSGGVKAWLESALGFPVNEFLLRKAAHFSEYALLGAECAFLLRALCAAHGSRLLLLPCAGFFAAAIDETIQIFSGRGSSLLDVWLDFSGFLTGFFAIYILFCLLSRGNKKK